MSTVGPVVKVGGSLFSLDRLPSQLSAWMARQGTAPSCLIAGGGQWADEVRAADRRFGLNDEAAHWLCIRAMRVTAQLLAHLLPGSRVVTELAPPPRCDALRVLDVEPFLRHTEPSTRGPRLPYSWDVSSDSIAARVATALGATELVLLKSALPPRASSIPQASHAGYFDRFFPIAARPVARIRCVNLAHESAPEVQWERPST